MILAQVHFILPHTDCFGVMHSSSLPRQIKLRNNLNENGSLMGEFSIGSVLIMTYLRIPLKQRLIYWSLVLLEAFFLLHILGPVLFTLLKLFVSLETILVYMMEGRLLSLLHLFHFVEMLQILVAHFSNFFSFIENWFFSHIIYTDCSFSSFFTWYTLITVSAHSTPPSFPPPLLPPEFVPFLSLIKQ